MHVFKDNPRRDEMAALIKEGVPRNMIASLMGFGTNGAVMKKAEYWELPLPAPRMEPSVFTALKACRMLHVGQGWRIKDDCTKEAQRNCQYKTMTRTLNTQTNFPGTYFFLHDGPNAWVIRLR